MLFILSMLVACDECEIADMPKSAKKLGEIGNSSRLLLTRFGKNVSFVVPEFDSFNEIPLPYLYSVIGFGAPFVVMFILMVLIFLFHQLFCWCCCCLPTRSKKPGCLAIVFHLIAMAACVAAACMFFFASSSFTRALKNVKHLPSATKKEFTGVFDTVDGVLDKTFALVHGVMNNTASNLTSFVDWIVTENTKCQGYCTEIDKVMDAYKTSLSKDDGNFQKPYKKIATALAACKPSDQQQKAWGAMYASVDIGVKAVHNVTEQLTKATKSINKNAENIRGTINGSLKDVNKKISEYENGGLRDTIKDFRTQINSLIDKTKPAEEGIEKYDKWINLSAYIGTCFLVVVTVILGLFFFCNNCCSRCVACCFPLFGLFLTLLIILPGVAFAAVFYIFYDVCLFPIFRVFL